MIIPFEYTSEEGLLGHMLFPLLISHHFPSACTSLHYHQPYTRFSFLQTALVLCLFYSSCPNICEAIAYRVLIFISLMVSDAEHRFMNMLTILISLLEKYYLFNLIKSRKNPLFNILPESQVNQLSITASNT